MKKWFKSTSLGMWWSNRKNGVTILSDAEYERLISKNRERKIIFI